MAFPVKMAKKPSILLHVCCAPCSTHVISILGREYDVACYFYNPNIQPEGEYLRRMETMREYAERLGVEFLPGEYDCEKWFELTRALKDEKEGGKRCEVCYRIRLEECARIASEKGYDVFATTLTIGPQKKAEVINRIGRDLAEVRGLRFLEEDFKKKDGFRHSVEMSKAENMYRQDYCGCIYSKVERGSKGK
jgi:predicted adenine nucleotide alpha hydrolase (AANH) superfamily ATPase